MTRDKKGGLGKIVFITKSAAETKKAAVVFAREILKKPISVPHALVIGLIGELGSGKTTFTQGFAQGLGIKERVLSPTFVLMRQYVLKKKTFQAFIHIDCYRLHNQKELIPLGWRTLVKNPQNLILIEWADRVAGLFPPAHIIIAFRTANETTRAISIAETRKA